MFKFRLVVTICFDDTFNVLRITFNHFNSMHDIPCETFFWNWIERAFVASVHVMNNAFSFRVCLFFFFLFLHRSLLSCNSKALPYLHTFGASICVQAHCPLFPSTSEPHTIEHTEISTQCTLIPHEMLVCVRQGWIHAYVCCCCYMWQWFMYLGKRIFQSFHSARTECNSVVVVPERPDVFKI